MNVYDSIKMGELLKPHGFEVTEQPEGADGDSHRHGGIGN